MKKRTFLLTLTVLLFTSCSKAVAEQGNVKSSFTKIAINPDEKVKEIMGDSIANIVFSPKATVMAYKLSPSETPSDNDRTIGGVKVANEIGKIDKTYYPIMQFLLSDSTSFSGEIIVPAIPFKATMALEFKLKKESVYLLYSFGSREISAVKNGKEVWHRHLSDIRKYMLFFYKTTQDKDLEFYLKK